MPEPKMTKEIEEECWGMFEGWAGYNSVRDHLQKKGFSKEAIDCFFERWQEGKSLYPYD